ncbi:SEC-C domain-containing protein [Rhodococcus sp. NPDC047139]|uniref:SEC-C domain-containing protein n=1 Tax=Rhodococcus sp. NPDC047139 TaxID=3155141 RepID=UPI00340B07D4
MTDSAYSESDLWGAALDAIRLLGPMTADELADQLEEKGFGPADKLVTDLEQSQPHPLLVWLSDDRIAALDALCEGRTLTHRLTVDDLARNSIPGDDVEPLLLLVSEDDDFDIVQPGESEHTGVQSDSDSGEFVPVETVVLPEGALSSCVPGDLLALTVRDGRLSFAPVDVEPGTGVSEFVDALEQDIARGQVASVENAFFDVLANTPEAFKAPNLPIGELLDEAGLVRSGDLVAPRGFDFDAYSDRAMFESYAEQLGIPVDAVPGVALFASLVESLDRGDESELEERFAVGKSGLYSVLSDPEIAETVYDELVGEGLAPEAIEQAALWLLDRAPRRVAGAAHWFAGRAAESTGRIVEAERHYERSADLDGAFDLPLFDLARFASDRGDAVRGLSLLARVPGGDEHPLYELLERYRPAEVPGLGRNDRCWCGSGRKYKACHLGRAEHSLEERSDWLYMKAAMHALEPVWAERRVALAEARSGYGDDDAVAEAVADPLVEDVLLFDSGAFADFLARRGDLLPEDEAELGRAWLDVERSVFEVETSSPGETLTLRDVRRDERVEVFTPWLSGEVPPGTLLCARVVPVGEGRWMMPGGCEPVTEDQRETLVALFSEGSVDPVELMDVLTRPDAADFYPEP